MKKILVIQTAFIGDVVLATAIPEKLSRYYPDAECHFLVRKGNESLLQNNPHIHKVWVWDKKTHKTRNLFHLILQIRKNKYDLVINLQRYFSTGLLTAASGASRKAGFDKNPLSLFYTKKTTHVFDTANPRHEVARNNDLIADITDGEVNRPKLYPSQADEVMVSAYALTPFVTMTPSSVWFTKKYPLDKWKELIEHFPTGYNIYLLGGNDSKTECDELALLAGNNNVKVLAGKLSFLQSAALMQKAVMNYTNDSAPLHFASAMNAPVTAIFCSTVPGFGYTPLSDISYIVETQLHLKCRPCGLHGFKTCPLGHFACAKSITNEQVMESICR